MIIIIIVIDMNNMMPIIIIDIISGSTSSSSSCSSHSCNDIIYKQSEVYKIFRLYRNKKTYPWIWFFILAVMVVFDVTNVVTLAHTAQWLEEAREANINSCPLVFLVGTKRDLMVRRSSLSFMDSLSHFLSYSYFVSLLLFSCFL